MGKNVFVSPNVDKSDKSKKWVVQEEGEVPFAFAVLKAEAVKLGKQRAKENKSELVVQKLNGRIGEKDSFGNDPSNVSG